jgi:arylsulfatase
MAAAVSVILAGGAHAAQQERPNVIVIIADDMGYSDISPFGGEIPTPNLQAMAEQGMRMSQYYTSPMSAPARSMLLTGNSNQQAGMGGVVVRQHHWQGGLRAAADRPRHHHGRAL